MSLSDLRPTAKEKVIDLVQRAGVDVADWSSGTRGASYAAANPKYCYEWSYVEPGKVVVLNMWFETMREVDGQIVQTNNFREDAKHYSSLGRKNWERRARKIDEALRAAMEGALPIRVIVNDGQRRPSRDPEAASSSVAKRKLDSEIWTVSQYDVRTGAHTIMRGGTPKYVDQFSADDLGTDNPERREVSGTQVCRDAKVRLAVLNRSRGSCEYCGEAGFKRRDGAIYLETHHIIPLSEEGSDRPSNVIALCPNHHREAHYGEAAEALRDAFTEIVATARSK